MNISRFAVTIFLTGLISACAGTGTTDIFASSNEPHVILEYPGTEQLRSGFYPVVLTRVDGRSMQSAQRRQFRLNPGAHTLALRPEFQVIVSNLPKQLDKNKVPGRFEEKTVTTFLEAGRTYTFGAIIRGESYTEWEPVVRRVK